MCVALESAVDFSHIQPPAPRVLYSIVINSCAAYNKQIVNIIPILRDV